MSERNAVFEVVTSIVLVGLIAAIWFVIRSIYFDDWGSIVGYGFSVIEFVLMVGLMNLLPSVLIAAIVDSASPKWIQALGAGFGIVILFINTVLWVMVALVRNAESDGLLLAIVVIISGSLLLIWFGVVFVSLFAYAFGEKVTKRIFFARNIWAFYWTATVKFIRRR